jgi:hypothetical protein
VQRGAEGVQEDAEAEGRNENFIITVGRRGSSSRGRRPMGGSDMQTRSGNLVIADLVGSTRHARYLGTRAGGAGPRKRLSRVDKGRGVESSLDSIGHRISTSTSL